MHIHRLLQLENDEDLLNVLECRPVLVRSSGSCYGDIFTIDDVDYLLSTVGLRMPFVALHNGRLGYTPFHDVQFQEKLFGVFGPGIVISEYLKNGTTLIIKHLQYLSPRVNELANALNSELFPYTVQCNAYLAPPSTQGVNEHADPHHTLLIQVSGRKRWLVWETINDAGQVAEINNKNNATSAKKIAESSSPIIDEIVEAGDVLYIPKGFVHTPYTTESHSLHVTFGIQRNSVASLSNKFSGEKVSGRLSAASRSVSSKPFGETANSFVSVL